MSNPFSITISGEGSSIGPIVTEVSKAYPRASFNDRTRQFRGAVEKESSLSRRMDSASQNRVSRAKQNLAKPDTADVKIVVRKNGTRETIEVSSGTVKRKFSFNFKSDNDSKFRRMLQDVVNGIAKVRERALAKNQS